MPKPIICLSEQFRQYLEIFQPCFSKRQWKNLRKQIFRVTVLLGLIEWVERKTMTGIFRMSGERISLSGLSRFLNKWPWSPEDVAQTWLNRFRERRAPMVQAEHDRLRAEKPKSIGRPKATVVTGYLIIDDSVHTKPKGKKMGGLGAHYSNTNQKVVNVHCLLAGLYVLLDRRCPLQPCMYRQRSVCEAEGEPFQSKIDMAVTEIEQFESAIGTQTHVWSIFGSTVNGCAKLLRNGIFISAAV